MTAAKPMTIEDYLDKWFPFADPKIEADLRAVLAAERAETIELCAKTLEHAKKCVSKVLLHSDTIDSAVGLIRALKSEDGGKP
jgi:hypothetical protein